MIVSILRDNQIKDFINLAEQYRLDCLIEAHTEEDLNKLGLPDKELISACNQIEVDAVLDLNQDFSSISATLCAEVPAPLKLGFYSDQGENYYNIMVRRTGEELAESGFKEIFQIIGIG